MQQDIPQDDSSQEPSQPLLLTIPQAAKSLGISRAMLSALLKDFPWHRQSFTEQEYPCSNPSVERGYEPIPVEGGHRRAIHQMG